MTTTYRPGYSGSGPGDITPDGCAVELYKRLPPDDSPKIVAAAVPPPATLLELGCGVGRMTRPLAALGFEVTAVDESAAMLAEVTGARDTVRSPIERLELGRTFDVVLLASFLVHAGDPAVRQGLLATCRRHVAPGGAVVIQREGEGWHTQVPRERPLLDGVARITASVDLGDGVREMHAEYVFPDAEWQQVFLSRPLTRAQFEEAVTAADLRVERYLDDARTWALARAGSGDGAA
ncbi:class I SAM-dependent methyltransferase [Actinoplanes sp. RD1]|uniref:class I SAM-dependent methyltransferase n=1 Tax=Actinoplanes sp. RD1 TaxID=3064538 RepID=UPI0027419F41|nr:class I SAM-dependent methyltransferase [Actinoplanes sp. RD1]